MTQPQVRLSQTVLQLGHDEAVADCLPLQLGGRLIQPLPKDRPQRPAFLLLRHRVEVFEHRAEEVDSFLDLGQALLGRLLGQPLALGSRRCSARTNPTVVPTTPAASATNSKLAASTGPRFRRTNFRKR